MSLPKTYKHAAFKEAGGPLVVEDVELTPPGKGEVLVKVEACGVCYSDMFAKLNIMGGGFPIVPGHELIGHVAAIGEGVSRWKVGDRIGGAWHGGHDGTCHACARGFYQMCDNQAVNGETRDGGYAEYCKLREEAGVRIPSHVDATKYAPIMCAGVTCFNSIRQMKLSPGSIVGVQGLGGLGHLGIQYANKMGFRVVAISRGSEKEKFARQLGAHEYIDTSKGDAGEALQKLGGASLIISTAPSAEAMPPLQKGLGILGRLVILSVPGEVAINTATMLRFGTSVQVWPCGHSTDTEEAIAFTELQNIDCMVERFPLAQAQDAFDAMSNGTVRFRAVLSMD